MNYLLLVHLCILGYNHFRELCGLSKIKSLSTPTPPSFINKRRWNVLRKMYSSPEDIDLFVGGVMEKTRKGMPGPTFTCINAEQFEALLKGKNCFTYCLHRSTPTSQVVAGTPAWRVGQSRRILMIESLYD